MTSVNKIWFDDSKEKKQANKTVKNVSCLDYDTTDAKCYNL